MRVRVDGTLRELADDIALARTGAPHDRGAGRSTHRASGHRAAARRLARGRLRARRRHRAGGGDGAGRWRAAAAVLQRAPRLPGVRGVVPGDRAALLLVQQPARRLSDVRRSRRARRLDPALLVPRADEAAARRARAGRRAGAARLRRGPDGARGALPVPARHAVRVAARGGPHGAPAMARRRRGDRRARARAALRAAVRSPASSRCSSGARARRAPPGCATRSRACRRSALSRRATARACDARRASCGRAAGASSTCRRCRLAMRSRFFDGLELGPQETEIARPILKEMRRAARLPRSTSGSTTSPSIGAPRRCRAARASASASRRRSARGWRACSTSSTSRRSGCTSGTRRACWRRSIALRDLGNTVIVVEHDREIILAADHVIDMGPGAGVHGGRVVAIGTPAEIMANPASLTGQYLSGARRDSGAGAAAARLGLEHRSPRGARQQPARLDVSSSRSGAMTCVTGVSGSGKSTLVIDTLYRALARRLGGGARRARRARRAGGLAARRQGDRHQPGAHRAQPPVEPGDLHGSLRPDPRAVRPAPGCRARGFGPGRFSFNVKGGRCEACAGDGVIAIEMHFLPDVYVTCEVCGGRRYDRETLEVKFKGLSIADVLDLSVEEALDVLGTVPPVRSASGRPARGRARLPASRAAGDDAVGRGGAAGEAGPRAGPPGDRPHPLRPRRAHHRPPLRRRPAAARGPRAAGGRGNTVLLIEHNLDVVKSADHVVDWAPTEVPRGAGGGGRDPRGGRGVRGVLHRPGPAAGPRRSRPDS